MTKDAIQLTGALEDYLETIYELILEQRVARVKDIARARDVKASSVTPAMRRLADMGLIKYVRREYIDLTPEGEKQARRIHTRHRLLTRFFQDFLQMPAASAQEEACVMEHNLSEEAMDRMVRFFEFMQACSEGKDFLARFHACAMVHEGSADCCNSCDSRVHRTALLTGGPAQTIADLKPGQLGKVVQVNGRGAIRQRLLDMGILPNTEIEVERVALTGDPIWIKLQGFQLSLRKKEAEAIVVA